MHSGMEEVRERGEGEGKGGRAPLDWTMAYHRPLPNQRRCCHRFHRRQRQRQRQRRHCYQRSYHHQVAIASEKYRLDPSVKSFEEQRAENKLARKKVGGLV